MRGTNAVRARRRRQEPRPAGAFTDLVKSDAGLVNARIFIDPEIYRQELEQIFTRTWLYVAHESEIPQPGDFVTRHMGEDPVIVARGADDKIRVFLNACRHRGMPVSTEYITGNIEAMSMDIWKDGFALFSATTDGELFTSTDRGDHWKKITVGLPPISKVGHFRYLGASSIKKGE